eukprot:12443004-Alexandrium_andersonii.AAC.1
MTSPQAHTAHGAWMAFRCPSMKLEAAGARKLRASPTLAWSSPPAALEAAEACGEHQSPPCSPDPSPAARSPG